MKTSRVELRVSPAEKEAFDSAAEMSGMTLAGWMRVRLRQASIRDLEDAGLQIPFLSMKRG